MEGGREGRREGGLTNRSSTSRDTTNRVFCDRDAARLLLNQLLLDLEFFYAKELKEEGKGGEGRGREEKVSFQEEEKTSKPT